MRTQKFSISDLTEGELGILNNILALLSQLPGELTDYLPVLGQLRKKTLGIRGRPGLGDKPKGYTVHHQIRASKPWK